MILIRRKAQGATEYAIFIAAVLAGLLALQVYYSRAVKGKVKSSAESIGEQFDLNAANYTSTSRSISSHNSATNTAAGGAWSNNTITVYADMNLVGQAGAMGANTTNFAGNEISRQTTNGKMTDSIVNNTTVWRDSGLQ